MSTQPGVEPDRIDVNDEAACEHWAKKLDTTKMQLHDAVATVGDKAMGRTGVRPNAVHLTTGIQSDRRFMGSPPFFDGNFLIRLLPIHGLLRPFTLV